MSCPCTVRISYQDHDDLRDVEARYRELLAADGQEDGADALQVECSQQIKQVNFMHTVGSLMLSPIHDSNCCVIDSVKKPKFILN